jgi:hypothetical protein
MNPGNTTAGPAATVGGASELVGGAGAGDDRFNGVTRPLEMLTFLTLFSYIISSV